MTTGSCFNANSVAQAEANEEHSGVCYSNIITRVGDIRADCFTIPDNIDLPTEYDEIIAAEEEEARIAAEEAAAAEE